VYPYDYDSLIEYLQVIRDIWGRADSP